jgi:hypothetical protein
MTLASLVPAPKLLFFPKEHYPVEASRAMNQNAVVSPSVNPGEPVLPSTQLTPLSMVLSWVSTEVAF